MTVLPLFHRFEGPIQFKASATRRGERSRKRRGREGRALADRTALPASPGSWGLGLPLDLVQLDHANHGAALCALYEGKPPVRFLHGRLDLLEYGAGALGAL